MSEYNLKIQQVVDYPRCRVYREFVQTLIADRNIRVNGCSGLFHYTVLCSYANFRTSYRRLDGISYCLLVFFRDGVVKKCSLKDHFEKTKLFHVLLNRADYFYSVNLQPGGYGVEWDVNMSVSDLMLYRIGKKVPLSAADFRSFIVHRIVNVAEAADILGCTRQNIEYLTRTGKLHPVKSSGKNTLYLKSEILKRNWQ